MVFQYLIRDLKTNFEIVQTVCSSLDEILELICPPAPVMDIWQEVEEHTSVLLRNELSQDPPIIFANSIATDTSSRSIIELAAAHLCHHCFAIKQAAQRGLGKLLLQDMPDVSDVLMDCFNRSEEHREGTLVVLDAVALTEPQSVAGFRVHVAPGYYSPGADWIAFNPFIARNLGWSLETDGLFRWVDSDGATTVESIWWVDGLVGLSASGPSSEEVGVGWLVLASQSALEQMRRQFGSLAKHSIVARKYNLDGEPVERSAASSDLL